MTDAAATISILLNGSPYAVTSTATVADLLTSRKLDPRRVAVEVNERLVRRDTFDHVRLAAGDRVEIVTFVGGG